MKLIIHLFFILRGYKLFNCKTVNMYRSLNSIEMSDQ